MLGSALVGQQQRGYTEKGANLSQRFLRPDCPPCAKTEFTQHYPGHMDAGNLIEAVLNHPNLAAPNGNLSSLLFGRSTSLLGGQGMSGNRRIDLQVKFSF